MNGGKLRKSIEKGLITYLQVFYNGVSLQFPNFNSMESLEFVVKKLPHKGVDFIIGICNLSRIEIVYNSPKGTFTLSNPLTYGFKK